MLGGKTPDQIVAERLKARRRLANPRPHGRAGPTDIAAARRIAEATKEVSQPDSNRWVVVAVAHALRGLSWATAAYGRLAMTRGSPVSSRMCTPVLARSTM